MKRFCFVGFILMFFILSVQSSIVYASAEYWTYGDYYDDINLGTSYRTGDSDLSYVRRSLPNAGPWTAVVVPNGHSYSQTSGYASAPSLATGLNAWAKSTPTNTHFTDAYIETSTSNRFTVNPGTSGLSIGDTVQLTLNVRLDGTLHTSSLEWPQLGWAHADIDASMTIVDYGIQIDMGEWIESPTLASFGASGEMESYHVNANYWNYGIDTSLDTYWRAESNITPSIDGGDSWSNRDYVSNGQSHSLDTGMLSIAFETIVGHTLDLDAYMSSYVNANNGGEAWADFGNTFRFDVDSAQTGIDLDWEIERQIVPLPGSFLLFVSGLIGLLGLRRKNPPRPEHIMV